MVEQAKKRVKVSIGRNKLSKNIPPIPFDNVSFNYEESVAKWKFVYHRRLKLKREPFIHACKCTEIIELLSDAPFLKTMMNVGLYYSKLVMNLMLLFLVDLIMLRVDN